MAAGLLPLMKILAVFGLMLLGMRLRLGIWLSILAGGAAQAVLFGMGARKFASAALDGLTQPGTLFLGAIVWLILILSGLYEKSGQSERLMHELSGLLTRPRLRLAFFPALIGLLPMPGGAVFSAPMISTASRGLDVTGEEMVAVNYWFRHIWELWWPLYPGLILAASIAGVPLSSIMLLGWPGTLVCVLLGWFFLLRPLPVLHCPGPGKSVKAGRILREGLPLLTAIAGSLLLEGALLWIRPGTPFEAAVLAAMTLAILICCLQNRLGARFLTGILFRRHLATMLLVVAAIFVFKEVLQQSGAVEQLARLAGGGAALMTAAVLLPFLVGLVSGITLAYVGAAFPLLVAMLEQLGMRDQMLPYLMLGIFSGFSGIMISPIHICFALSCQYFGVEPGRAWRRIAIPCTLLLCSGPVYFLLLR